MVANFITEKCPRVVEEETELTEQAPARVAAPQMRCNGTGCKTREQEYGILPNVAVITTRHRCATCREGELRDEMIIVVQDFFRVKDRREKYIFGAITHAQALKDVKMFKGTGQMSVANLCSALKWCGYTHVDDDGNVCLPVNRARLTSVCSCVVSERAETCTWLCGLCAKRTATETASVSTVCAICKKDGGKNCSICESIYHISCLAPVYNVPSSGVWA